MFPTGHIEKNALHLPGIAGKEVQFRKQYNFMKTKMAYRKKAAGNTRDILHFLLYCEKRQGSSTQKNAICQLPLFF